MTGETDEGVVGIRDSFVLNEPTFNLNDKVLGI